MSTESLLQRPEVERRVGLGCTSIYAGIAAGTFPRPIKSGKRSLWVESEVEKWIADRIAERDMVGNMGRQNAA